MAYYESLDQHKKEIKPIVQWSLDYCFYQIQVALIGYLENFTWLTRVTLAPIFRLLPIGRYPSDRLGQTISRLIQTNVAFRDDFTSSVFIPNGDKDGIAKLNSTYIKIIGAQGAIKKIKHAIKTKVLPKKSISVLLNDALDKQIISIEDAKLISEAEVARMDAIQVDAFSNDDYLKNA